MEKILRLIEEEDSISILAENSFNEALNLLFKYGL